jgi:ribosome-binding protein aMBF1 (putative translation factor)
MTNETTQTSKPDQINYTIGARLKSAREAMGMDQKEVATHLRLHEKMINMLEKDTYPNDHRTSSYAAISAPTANSYSFLNMK